MTEITISGRYGVIVIAWLGLVKDVRTDVTGADDFNVPRVT